MQNRIIQRNQQYGKAVEQLLAELKNRDVEALNRRPADGGWSAAQTAWHVMLAEELAYAYVRKKLSYGGDFKTVGWGERWRMWLLKIALALPIKFRAPQMTSEEHFPNHITWQELANHWQVLRADWTIFLESLPENLINKAVFKHPRAGKIGWTQMLSFFEDHLERHQKQIRRALNA